MAEEIWKLGICIFECQILALKTGKIEKSENHKIH